MLYYAFIAVTASWIAVLRKFGGRSALSAGSFERRIRVARSSNAPRMSRKHVIRHSFLELFMGGMIIVPAQDVSAFRALLAMVMSLVYLVYHTHGWACLLLGCAVLKTRSFSRILGWLFVFIGIVQIPTTIVPQLARGNLIAILLSGLGTGWIGIALLRQKQPQPALKELAASK
jgi:hypothetical protein